MRDACLEKLVAPLDESMRPVKADRMHLGKEHDLMIAPPRSGFDKRSQDRAPRTLPAPRCEYRHATYMADTPQAVGFDR